MREIFRNITTDHRNLYIHQKKKESNYSRTRFSRVSDNIWSHVEMLSLRSTCTIHIPVLISFRINRTSPEAHSPSSSPTHKRWLPPLRFPYRKTPVTVDFLRHQTPVFSCFYVNACAIRRGVKVHSITSHGGETEQKTQWGFLMNRARPYQAPRFWISGGITSNEFRFYSWRCI